MGSRGRGARRPYFRGGTHVSELWFLGPEKYRAVSVVRREVDRRSPGTGGEAGAERGSGVGHPRRRPPSRRVREVPQSGGTRTHESRGPRLAHRGPRREDGGRCDDKGGRSETRRDEGARRAVARPAGRRIPVRVDAREQGARQWSASQDIDPRGRESERPRERPRSREWPRERAWSHERPGERRRPG